MRRRFQIVFVLVLVLVAFAAGCGDDDDDNNDDTAVTDDDNDDNDNDDNDNDDNDNDDDDDNDDNDDNDDDDDDDDDTPVPQITDEQGREIILHGCNYMGLEFGWFNHAQEDFDRIASWGFTHVRLPFSWRFMEPEEGVWDATYLTDTVEPVLDMIYAAGLSAVPDMHQWQWCSTFGGNGAPSWACEGQYEPTMLGLIEFAGDFWTRGLDQHWADAWELTWQHLADHPAIWGWDLFNEPWAGVATILPSFETDTLAPFYQQLYDTLRTYDDQAWVLLEPSLGSTILPSHLPPIEGERLVLSPHLYTGLTSFNDVGYWFPPSLFEMDMRKTDRDRARTGYPVVTGEFGVTTQSDGALDWMRDAVAAHDDYLYGEIVWTYWKSDGGWSLLFADGSEKTEFLFYLLRPYPRAVAGHIVSYGFDPDTGVFTLTFTNTDATGPTEIFVPERHYADGFEVQCSDPPTLWSYTHDAEAQVISITTDPASSEHTITVVSL